jgi:hypothetical protein
MPTLSPSPTPSASPSPSPVPSLQPIPSPTPVVVAPAPACPNQPANSAAVARINCGKLCTTSMGHYDS